MVSLSLANYNSNYVLSRSPDYPKPPHFSFVPSLSLHFSKVHIILPTTSFLNNNIYLTISGILLMITDVTLIWDPY
jgi:hypothetical protein